MTVARAKSIPVSEKTALAAIDAQNRQRRNAASAVLMALKPSIQGPNKDKIIAAIDDTLERLK
jgi:hypothetical protein